MDRSEYKKEYPPSESIPVTFEWEGKEYHGTLESVHGRGMVCWDLMVDNYHWGTLGLFGDEFRFSSPSKPGMKVLTDYFRDVVVAWRDSRV